MSKKEHEQPSDSNDLERIDLKVRTNRGAVVSVRLTPAEAQGVATRASNAGLSVSEYARRTLRQSLSTNWRIMVSYALAPLAFGLPPETGGDYGQSSSNDVSTAVTA